MNLKQLQANWNTFGERDPLWAILTLPEAKGGKWNEEEFFRTGEREIAQVMQHAERFQPLTRRRALDFGCGVGRLTQALAAYFEEVAGVDIAESMLERARRYNRHGECCRYYLNTRPDLSLFPDGRFDFVYSNITLQHVEPRYVKHYVREFVRVLAPGGVVLFQLPAEPLTRRDRVIERLVPAPLLHFYRYHYFRRQFPGQPQMEMNGLPRPVVERLLRTAGARILDVAPDHHAAGIRSSYLYCATRAR